MFRNGAYATIWEIQEKGKNCIVSLSTSRRDKKTNEYVTDFSSKFVLFVGAAAERVKSLEERARIQIKECSVGNVYDKEKKTTYWNTYVYDFDLVEAKKEEKKETPQNVTTNTDDDMPF